MAWLADLPCARRPRGGVRSRSRPPPCRRRRLWRPEEHPGPRPLSGGLSILDRQRKLSMSLCGTPGSVIALHREICGIRRARHLPRLKVVQRGGRPPSPAPDLVDRAPARGGEQPGPPVRLVPRKPGSPRTTCSQVSAAMSSAASGAITRRYRSKAGLASRHSRVRAASLPDWAAVSTAASSWPTTGPSIGTLAPSRSRSSALVSNGMRLLATGRQTGSRWRRSAVVPVTLHRCRVHAGGQGALWPWSR